MKTSRNAWILASAIAPIIFTNSAMAALPVDRAVVYSIRKSPGDPQSPVVFTMTLHLAAHHADGNFVSWEVERATFDRLGANPKQWIKWYPALTESPDRYWTIEHADPQNPRTTEFAVPPRLTGTAETQGTGYDDLDYDFQAVYDSGRLALGQTSATYRFQQVAAPEPEEEAEEEEPVEVDDFEDMT